MATGPATTSGPVTCTPAPGASSTSGPPVKVLVGANGTEVISQGESAGNTAEGTFHLASCGVYPADTGLSRCAAIRATVDPVTATGARPARASAMARFAVRSPAGGGGRTAAWWPWLLVAAAVGWNLVSLRALTVGVTYLNDSSLHEQMVRFATAQLRAGHLPLDELVPVPRRGVAAVPSLPEPAGDPRPARSVC